MSGTTKRLLAIATASFTAIACADLLSANGADPLVLGPAFQTVPVGFSANTNSFEANATWMWADNALFGITYFLNRMNNAFGFLIPDAKADQQIIQIDWTFKF